VEDKKMKLFSTLSLLTLTALLSISCATMNKEQCQNADWFEVGERDGANGYSSDRIGAHKKACGEHGIQPNVVEYKKGRTEGLKAYCTYENGLLKGRNGYYYSGVCPSHLAPDFLRGYEIGQREYELKKREEELRKREQELEEKRRKEASLRRNKTNTVVVVKERPTRTRTVIVRELPTRTVVVKEPSRKRVIKRKVVNKPHRTKLYKPNNRPKKIKVRSHDLTSKKSRKYSKNRRLKKTALLGQSCKFSSQCVKRGKCSLGRCSNTGKRCSSDSSCRQRGYCDSSRRCRF
jgi:hypothetical protein